MARLLSFSPATRLMLRAVASYRSVVVCSRHPPPAHLQMRASSSTFQRASLGGIFTAARMGDHNKEFAEQAQEDRERFRKQANDDSGDSASSAPPRPNRIVIPSLSSGSTSSRPNRHQTSQTNDRKAAYVGRDGKPLFFASTTPKSISELPFDSDAYVQSPQPPRQPKRSPKEELPRVTYRRELVLDEAENLPNSAVLDALPGEEASYLRRQQEAHRTRVAIDAQNEQLYWANRSHLRKQKRLEDEFGGLEEAIEENLLPSTTSLRSDLKKRPLDRGILEEIHRGLHGRRAETRLKKGVSVERWVMKNEANLPVLEASKVAQATFGFGGQVLKKANASATPMWPSTASSKGPPPRLISTKLAGD